MTEFDLYLNLHCYIIEHHFEYQYFSHKYLPDISELPYLPTHYPDIKGVKIVLQTRGMRKL